MANDPRLKTRARQRLRAVKAIGHPPCWRCGGEIDYAAPMWDPDSYHLDEIISRCNGGDPLDPDNTAPAHNHCNTRAGGIVGNRRSRGMADVVDPEPRPMTNW